VRISTAQGMAGVVRMALHYQTEIVQVDGGNLPPFTANWRHLSPSAPLARAPGPETLIFASDHPRPPGTGKRARLSPPMTPPPFNFGQRKDFLLERCPELKNVQGGHSPNPLACAYIWVSFCQPDQLACCGCDIGCEPPSTCADRSRVRLCFLSYHALSAESESASIAKYH
jgi:hypothetical protein